MEKEEIQDKAAQLSRNIVATMQGTEPIAFLKKDFEGKYQAVFKDLMKLVAENIRKRGYQCEYKFKGDDGGIAVCQLAVEKPIRLNRIRGNRLKR